jgi:hypothetical protein
MVKAPRKIPLFGQPGFTSWFMLIAYTLLNKTVELTIPSGQKEQFIGVA